jgi:hypothetical protein
MVISVVPGEPPPPPCGDGGATLTSSPAFTPSGTANSKAPEPSSRWTFFLVVGHCVSFLVSLFAV